MPPATLPARTSAGRRLRRRLAAVRERWPLTGAGAATAALSVAALFWGRRHQDFVLALAGAYGLLVLFSAGVCALARALWLRRDFRRAAARGGGPLLAIEGRPTDTGLRLPDRRVPLSVAPALVWVRPPAHGALTPRSGRHAERVHPADRRLAAEIERLAICRDLLGLWRVAVTLNERRPVLVLPDDEKFRAEEIVSCLASGDLMPHPFGRPAGDRVDHRTYTRTDPARLILWKVYARTRELLVRVPEPARTPEREPLIFLVAGERDQAAAGLARFLVESGLLGREVRLAADGSPHPVRGARPAREAIALSADMRERGGADLAAALSDPDVAPDDPVLLVCPAASGPWMARVLPRIAADPDRFLLFAAADLAPLRRDGPRWRRWFLRVPDGRGPALAEAARALGPLARTGARLLLADRASGRVVVLAAPSGAPARRVAV